MKTNTNLIVVTILLAVLPLFAADVGKRHKETAGGFSFCPPEGWTIQSFPGMKYSIAAGPAANGFAPNINVVDETADVSLPAYVDASKKMLSKAFKDYKELGKREFKTTAGLKGTSLIIQSNQNGTQLRQAFYFFAGTGDKKFVVTCSSLASGGEKIGEVFEASLKTFVLD
jgi:hypothetical protein